MIKVDIKYVYIHQQKRNAYLLTFLCMFCQHTAVWDHQYTKKSKDGAGPVVEPLNKAELRKYIEEEEVRILIRIDNCPQFIAGILAEIMESPRIAYEFIQPEAWNLELGTWN